MRLNFKLLALFILPFLVACNNEKTNDISYNDFKFLEYTIEEMHKGYINGDLTVVEVVEAYLNRIEQIDKNGPELNSVISINPDAIEIAKQLDEELKAGKIRDPLHGIPVMLKDNIDTHDKMPTTAGSRALANSYPLKDSFVAKKLREAGAVIIGKTSLSEWANFRGELSTSDGAELVV